MNILFYVIAVLILGVIVVIHELGHFITGRALGFKVLEFAIGFGPKLIKWERKGIKYSIRLLPLGGFCSFEGEDGENPSPQAMNNMPWYKRIPVLFAGAGFNIIFALIVGFVLFLTSGYNVPVINKVTPGTPAAQTEITAGDVIVAVNGVKIKTYDQLSQLLAEASKDEKAVVTMRRGDKTFDVETGFYSDYDRTLGIQVNINADSKLSVVDVDESSGFFNKGLQNGDLIISLNGKDASTTALLSDILLSCTDADATLVVRRDNNDITVQGTLTETKRSRIGIELSYSNAPMPVGEAFVKSLEADWEMTVEVLKFLGKLVIGQGDISQVTGPVSTIGTMGSLVSQSAAGGFGSVIIMILNLLWAISLNLAVFNLLPIPALDGARILFVLIEGIFKKPVPRKVEGIIHFVGLVLLFGLVFVVEISKLFIPGGGLTLWM